MSTLALSRGKRLTPPAWPFTLNRDNPLTRGMVAAFVPFAGAVGMHDLVRGVNLVKNGTADFSISSRFGTQSVRLDANSEAYQATAPAGLKLALPISIAMGIESLSNTPTANASLFGVTHNNAASSPFISYAFARASTDTSCVAFSFNDGGTFRNPFNDDTDLDTAVGSHHDFAAVLSSGDTRMYRNGVLGASNTTAYSNPTYGATALVTFGDGVFAARHPSARLTYGFVWNRKLLASEAVALTNFATRWDLYYEIGRTTYFVPAAVTFNAAWARGSNVLLQPGIAA